MSTASELKAAGNAAFKSRSYDEAITQYSAAIAAAGEEKDVLATCHLNRAMAQLKLADGSARGATGDASQRRRELLEAALEDARAGAVHDPASAKAPFREAVACLQLGGRQKEAVDALHRAWRTAPGDTEVRRLLLQEDAVFARFEEEIERLRKGLEGRRTTLHQMVSRSHPMNIRNNYYKVWMCVWTPEDRECALSTAFMKVLEGFDKMLVNEAHGLAVADKEAGKVDFGEDGFGVFRHKQSRNEILRKEGYDMVSIVLEDLCTETCYNQGDIYCANVEAVSEGREDEPRWLPEHRRERLHALRPTLLMGDMCASHPLKEWMISKMSENMRKQVLISVCLEVCMSAAGLAKTQVEAMFELRNLKRKERGLPPLKPGEFEEDDEIMEKSDFEAYQERTLIGGREAMRLMKEGSQSVPGNRKPVDVGEGLPAPKPEPGVVV